MIDTIILHDPEYTDSKEALELHERKNQRFSYFASCRIPFSSGGFGRARFVEYRNRPGFQLFLGLELPKVLHRHNVSLLDHEETVFAFETLQRNLLDTGIVIDVNSMNICGLHLSHDIQTEQPIAVYLSILRELLIPRLDLSIYPNGIAFSNRAKRLSFHNKGTAQKFKGLPWTDGLQVLRMEYQLRKIRTIKAITGVSSVKGLVSDFKRIQNQYHEMLTSLIGAIAVNPEAEVRQRLYESLKNSGRKHPARRLLQEMFSIIVEQNYGDRMTFKQSVWPLLTRSSRQTLTTYLSSYQTGPLKGGHDCMAVIEELLSKI